jgi:hypothetical protein
MTSTALLRYAMIAGFAIGIAATPASARYGRNAAFVGGLLAGAVAGAAITGAAEYPRPYYYYRNPYYYPGPRVYYAPPPPPPVYYYGRRPGYCGVPPYPPCY